MKYYVVFTDEGPQLVNTKGDVKAAGQKKLETREVPTDKDGLRDFVNALYKEAYSRTPEPVSSVETKTDKPKTAPITTDDIVIGILDSESYHFSNIFAAVMEKFDRLKQDAAKLKLS